jgi:acetylornithine deacetylase/succinyl-diaminopimelate desuccinylase family protein
VSALRERVWAEIDRRRDWLVGLCQALVRRNTENPPGPTTACADLVADELAARGLPVERVEPRPGLVSLVSRTGSGGRHFMLNGHMDVFPADDPALWTVPPFEGVVRDGRIYGRGVADMKGGFTASLATVLLLRELGVPLRGRLSFMAVADEETGGHWGTKWLLDHRADLRPDACLIGEPCSPDAVRVGEKGVAWIYLTSRGRSYHGSLAAGDNAITRLAEAIGVVRRIVEEPGETPAELVSVIEGARRHYLNDDYRGREWLLERPSCNVGVIQGGIKANVAPREATAEVDIRIPFGWAPERVLAWVRERLAAAGIEGVEARLFEHACPPTYTSPAHPLARTVHRHATAALGAPPTFTITTGGTDGRFFRMRDVPTVIYGPRPHAVGGLDEYILVEDLVRVTKVHAATVLDFVGEGGEAA